MTNGNNRQIILGKSRHQLMSDADKYKKQMALSFSKQELDKMKEEGKKLDEEYKKKKDFNKPKDLKELRTHQMVKLKHHDEGIFWFTFIAKKDQMPILLVSSKVDKKIKDEYVKMADHDDLMEPLTGTYTVKIKEKAVDFLWSTETKDLLESSFWDNGKENANYRKLLGEALQKLVPDDRNKILWGGKPLV